jgi:hypothetical protein
MLWSIERIREEGIHTIEVGSGGASQRNLGELLIWQEAD